ncbi:MAG: hypothetical protein IPJ87_01540 [Flavobacteriales bacterium]|nr:hypothetical protein [Flavobacteriales bacterium]MBK7940556.1 hypothetical protein [Flavobacteriales bacterium]MBK8950299.1 hypothetical protein [Flavobacteriales bacterium]MBK9701025.1 hypothetical protein [Flavobacteriales bacterium]
MGRKREAFGLSLLDVLSNALVGAIVLMLIASMFTRVLSDTAVIDDAGDSDIQTLQLVKPTDKRRSDYVLNIALTMKGGIDVPYEVVPELIEGIDPLAFDTCVEVLRGAYGDSLWLITRSCTWPHGAWGVRVRALGSARDVPDSALVHYNLGVNPIGENYNRRLGVPPSFDTKYLIEIKEGCRDSVPCITTY